MLLSEVKAMVGIHYVYYKLYVLLLYCENDTVILTENENLHELELIMIAQF